MTTYPHDNHIEWFCPNPNIQATIDEIEALTNDEIATAAVAIAKLETIRRMIEGRRLIYSDAADEAEYKSNLLALILGEIDGVNYDHLPSDLPPS